MCVTEGESADASTRMILIGVDDGRIMMLIGVDDGRIMTSLT